MITLSDDGWYESSVLATNPRVLHGFSTRMLGDARSESVRDDMMRRKGLGDRIVSRGKQIHGSHVEIITDHSHSLIENTDALVTSTVGVNIGVVTADCVPIILLDSKRMVISAVHAGWKGILAGVIEETVRVMREEGADPDSIVASIGPHISACCYSVSEERAHQFSRTFRDETVAGRNERGWYVDIGMASRVLLTNSGISNAHIDAALLCTSCQNDRFYSYRKDTKETFGEMLSFISLI